MESLPIPPLTRFDAVMWFLRVQLWVSVVLAVTNSLTSAILFLPPLLIAGGRGSSFLFLSGVIVAWIPCLVLLTFPSALTSSALGDSKRNPLISTRDWKFLIARCVGLAALIGSLGRVVFLPFDIAYDLFVGMSWSTVLSGPRFYSNTGPFLSFILGFVLAFGPAIRDALRPR